MTGGADSPPPHRPCSIGRGGLPRLVPILCYGLWQTVFFTSWAVALATGHASQPWFDTRLTDGLSLSNEDAVQAARLLVPVGGAALALFLVISLF